MQLIKVESGSIGEVQAAVAPVFQHGRVYSKMYVRIIYPLIIFELIFALLLFTQVGKSQRFIFFSLFIFSLSLYMLKFQLYGTVYALTSSRISLFIPISFLLVAWPSLYFFLRQSVEKKAIPIKEFLVHFSPAALFLIFQIGSFLMYPLSEELIYNSFDSVLVPIEQALFILGGFYYGWKILKIRKAVPQKNSSSSVRLRYSIFTAFVFAVTVLLSLMLFSNFFLYKGQVTTLDYHLLWLMFTLFLPWFCYEAWRNREGFMLITSQAYRLSDQKLSALKDNFDQILRDGKTIKDPALGLANIAQLLQVSPREITELIRRAYKSNFYEVVNSSRVEMVKTKLLQSDFDHLTNEAIGQLCGFRSKTTFIKAFRKVTGLTPRQYKENHKVSA